MQTMREPGSSIDKFLEVGIGELVVSADPGAVLVANALGPCIVVLAYDPLRSIGGMLHFLLPSSAISRTDIEKRPALFADTGVPLLVERMTLGGMTRPELVVKVAGGATPQQRNPFALGRRNYFALRRALEQRGLSISSEAVGGNVSRTVRLCVGSGRMSLHTGDPSNERAL